MATIKYYKRVEDSKLIFIRVTRAFEGIELLVQDLEVVKMRAEDRYEYGIDKMQHIDTEEFYDLVNKYNLGLPISQPLAAAPQRNQHKP